MNVCMCYLNMNACTCACVYVLHISKDAFILVSVDCLPDKSIGSVTTICFIWCHEAQFLGYMHFVLPKQQLCIPPIYTVYLYMHMH